MPKVHFNKVCIVGVGLLGGSIGLALKKQKLAKTVIGISRSKQTLALAKKNRAIDEGYQPNRFCDVSRDSDLIVLAAPITKIHEYLKLISKFSHQYKNSLIIDVASTKANIEKACKRLSIDHLYVGCHPMAGSEKSGVENASAELFKGSFCFVLKNNARIAALWKALGSRSYQIDAHDHDKWVGLVSHMPHILSFTLLDMPLQKNRRLVSAYRGFVNPSLRHFLRLAKSNPDIWEEILLDNRAVLKSVIREYQKKLAAFERAIDRSDCKSIRNLIQSANHMAFDLSEDN